MQFVFWETFTLPLHGGWGCLCTEDAALSPPPERAGSLSHPCGRSGDPTQHLRAVTRGAAAAISVYRAARVTFLHPQPWPIHARVSASKSTFQPQPNTCSSREAISPFSELLQEGVCVCVSVCVSVCVCVCVCMCVCVCVCIYSG